MAGWSKDRLANPDLPRLTEHLHVLLAPTDVRKIETIARALGMTKTQWARDTLLEALQPTEQT